MISKKTFRTLLVTLGLCLLAGCASTSGPRTTRARYSANQYLQMAVSATGNTKQAYLLRAANRFIDVRQVSLAQFVYNQTSNDLPPNLRLKKQLISAKLLMAYNQNDNALNALQAMNQDHSAWMREDKIEWHTIAAQANEKLGNVNASIAQRSAVIPLLPSDEQKSRLLSIWRTLENISTQRIRNLLAQATTPTVKGWLSLATITDQSNVTPQALSQQLQSWKAEYPGHPATALLPSNIRQLNNIPTNHPRRIALLLPLTGHYASAGNAIRNGFFAAYYNAKERGQATSEIIIVNTANKNIAAAYQEAVSKGANFIVGPLTKNNVANLAKATRISVPTLALNSPPSLTNRAISNLYQFGLSPIDEAKQAAMKAWDAHRHSALLIAPNNAWGQTIAKAFESTWQALGGQIVGKLAYSGQQKLSQEVRHLLNVDQASWNETVLKRVLRERLRYIPRRRKDADVIFMMATPGMARQIRPLLNYYYAGGIPVYSISNIYSGLPNAHRDRDLNGIRFPDMPWVLSGRMKPASLNAVRQHVKSIWPKSYALQPKLFALGVDAYDIIPKLNKMAVLPDLGTPAATGTLYLDKNHHIYRKLRWSKISGGLPHKFQ